MQALDEIKGETSRTDYLKIRLHLPVLWFYLKNIDKLNLDSIAASKSVKFVRQILAKYSSLVHKKLYRRLSAKLISSSIRNLTIAVFKGSLDRTKEAYTDFWIRLNKLKSSPNKQEPLEDNSTDEEFDLT